MAENGKLLCSNREYDTQLASSLFSSKKGIIKNGEILEMFF